MVAVPVGGGGLIAGVRSYIKAVKPEVRVIGVEPLESDALYRSLAVGRRIVLDRVGLFGDGVAVREIGETTFAMARQVVDEVVRVTNDEVCAAIKKIFDDTRTAAEPAGALAVAGLRRLVEQDGIQGTRLVAILSGANMNFDRLRFVAERAEIGEAREAIRAVTIPERPGAFRALCAAIGGRVLTEFNYRVSGRRDAHIFVGVWVGSRRDAAPLVAQLTSDGYETTDVSDDEMAKLHVRHMVGGRAADVQGECVCRFEFSERPGALIQFLETLGDRWNISLFYYRNHGTDFGRVLAAFEVPDADRESFHTFLDSLGYQYNMEPVNRAYRFVFELVGADCPEPRRVHSRGPAVRALIVRREIWPQTVRQ